MSKLAEILSGHQKIVQFWIHIIIFLCVPTFIAEVFFLLYATIKYNIPVSKVFDFKNNIWDIFKINKILSRLNKNQRSLRSMKYQFDVKISRLVERNKRWKRGRLMILYCARLTLMFFLLFFNIGIFTFVLFSLLIISSYCINSWNNATSNNIHHDQLRFEIINSSLSSLINDKNNIDEKQKEHNFSTQIFQEIQKGTKRIIETISLPGNLCSFQTLRQKNQQLIFDNQNMKFHLYFPNDTMIDASEIRPSCFIYALDGELTTNSSDFGWISNQPTNYKINQVIKRSTSPNSSQYNLCLIESLNNYNPFKDQDIFKQQQEFFKNYEDNLKKFKNDQDLKDNIKN